MSLLQQRSALRAQGGHHTSSRNCTSASSCRALRVVYKGYNVRRDVVVKAVDEVRDI
jgi:hypothetical protein